MRFVVTKKSETEIHYVIELGNRTDEERYELFGTSVYVRKDAKFGGGLPTPEEDNRRWFDGIAIGSVFKLEPVAVIS